MNAVSNSLLSVQNGDNTSPPEWPEGIPIPESFICPLSRRLMVHPVIDKEGNSYERDAIKIYLTATEGMSPTNQQLNTSDLIENRGLKMAIEVALQSAHEQKKSKSRGPVLKRFSLARRRSSLSRESSGRSNQSPLSSRGNANSLHRQGIPSRESEHSLQNNMSRKSSKSQMSVEDKPSLIEVTHEEMKFDEPFDVSTKIDSDTSNRRPSHRNVSRSSSRSSIVSEEDLQKSIEERPELAMLEHQDIKFIRRLPDPDNGGAASPTSYRRKISKSHSPKRSTPNRDEFDSESGSEDEVDLAILEHYGIKFATLSGFNLKSSLRSSTSSLGDLVDVAQLAENEESTNHNAFKTNLEELRTTIPAQQSQKVSTEPRTANKESKDSSSKTTASSSTLRASNSKRASSSRLSIRQSANPDDFKAFEKGLAELRGLASALRQDSMKRGSESNADDTRSTADLSCSWGDLSGDIARAQTMSLTVSKNDESQLEACLHTDGRQVSTDGSEGKRRKSRRDKSRKSANRKSTSDKSSERIKRSSNKSTERNSSRRSKSSQSRDKHVNKTEPEPEHKHRTSQRRGDVKIDAQVVPSYQPQRSGRRRRSRSNKRVQAVE